MEPTGAFAPRPFSAQGAGKGAAQAQVLSKGPGIGVGDGFAQGAQFGTGSLVVEVELARDAGAHAFEQTTQCLSPGGMTSGAKRQRTGGVTRYVLDQNTLAVQRVGSAVVGAFARRAFEFREKQFVAHVKL